MLFPALEAATGETQGPTAVMRGEHDQMRGLLSQFDETVRTRDARCLGLTDTLMVLVQQHNMKEGHVLYPMADQRLADDDALVGRLFGVQVTPHLRWSATGGSSTR